MLHSKPLTDLFDPIQTELNLTFENLYQNLSSDNPLINRIISYVLSTGGKRIRPALCLLTSKLLNENIENHHITIAQVVETIHTASLVHDDVIDDADIRRGHKTVKALWDNKTTVICGDYLLAKASVLISTLENTEIVLIFSKVLEELCNGEIQQTNLTFDTSITWDDYLLKSTRKTAMLFASGPHASAIISKASPEKMLAIKNYGLNYGLAFQIVDDILNFCTTDQVGKPSCDDLKNGILTAPVIYAIEEYPELAKIIDTTFDKEENFDRALEIITNSSSISKSKELAKSFVQQAVDSLESFPSSPAKSSLIHLAEYVIKREF